MVRLAAVAAVAAATLVVAHPGEHHDHAQVKREVFARDVLASKQARSLSKCAGSLKTRALHERAVARRAATAERLRKERGITKAVKHRRDLTALQEFETVNHNMTGVNGVSFVADSYFTGNTSCIMTPENTIGPYYVTGELIRRDVTEGQAGVPLHLDLQFVDVNTCEPVPNLFIDIWAANATGVYSGIDVSNGQGGLNSTFLRGVQDTDDEGVTQFDTIFPGHYSGRATHEHVVAHVNASAAANGTMIGGTVAHIGQLFFDETLRSAVEATTPYSENTVEATTNDDDMWAPYQADNSYDPFPDFIYLNSEDITDGLLAWISIGIDVTADRDSNATAAAYLDASGGHSTGNTVGGGGGDGAAPSGAMPSGAVPSGAAPSGTVSKRSWFAEKMFNGAARLI
ncbi:aromatic compound dioxygenase [Diplodia corticola]|uniref:Aromatic compound dioxygenase n=1 Tax=Diplodia corticola TaxID=236234 RepID=A0A1J9RP84_9PEZI|nr:aromatic compound dioxygenase [Diplodia corticola]OJD34363.1 aromatic compound dioxygenase [Diplodia corticola]